MATLPAAAGVAPGPATAWRRFAAALTLVALAPVVANVLFGAIRVSFILAVLPAAAAWGLGALLVRELVRRRRLGWAGMLLLGVALALAEECVFLQTSLLPLLGVDPAHVYGRAFGVNWPYLLWALGYESVWAVAVPVALVEWVYPDRRDVPWLGRGAFAAAVAVFLGSGVLRWYGWTQVFLPENFPAWAHQASPVAVGAALATAVGLVAAAVRGVGTRAQAAGGTPGASPAPRPWVVGTGALVAGLAWSVLVFLAYGVRPAWPVVPVLAGGVGLAVASVTTYGRWVGRRGWGDAHALALVTGALVASMSAGFLVLHGGNAPRVDYVGKAVLNAAALLGLAWLALRFRRDAARR